MRVDFLSGSIRTLQGSFIGRSQMIERHCVTSGAFGRYCVYKSHGFVRMITREFGRMFILDARNIQPRSPLLLSR